MGVNRNKSYEKLFEVSCSKSEFFDMSDTLHVTYLASVLNIS